MLHNDLDCGAPGRDRRNHGRHFVEPRGLRGQAPIAVMVESGAGRVARIADKARSEAWDLIRERPPRDCTPDTLEHELIMTHVQRAGPDLAGAGGTVPIRIGIQPDVERGRRTLVHPVVCVVNAVSVRIQIHVLRGGRLDQDRDPTESQDQRQGREPMDYSASHSHGSDVPRSC